MTDNKVEFGNRKQFLYNLKPGSTLVYGKVVLGDAGAVSSIAGFHGVDNVTRLNPTARTGVYRVEFTNRYLDLEGFWASTTLVEGGDAYGCGLLSDHVTGYSGVADAYQDGYCTIQFMQGGTAATPTDETVFLHFLLKTSEQG